MLSTRLANFGRVIRLGGNVRVLRIAREIVPVVLHRPVVAKIGFTAGAAFVSSASLTAKCMDVNALLHEEVDMEDLFGVPKSSHLSDSRVKMAVTTGEGLYSTKQLSGAETCAVKLVGDQNQGAP